MPDEPRPTVDDVMVQARRQFLEAARRTLDHFEQLGVALSVDPGADVVLTAMQRELHRLNGSAATFGFPRVGRMAFALESAVKKWAPDPALDRERRAPVVARFVQSLRQEIAGHTGEFPVGGTRRLFIVGLRDAVAVPLTTEAGARGFDVERVGADELDDALHDSRPDGVIAVQGTPVGPALDGVALLLVGAPPHDASAILDSLEKRIADAAPPDVGSVLLVDDDPVMRTLVQVACAQAHLGVTATADAAAFRAALQAMSPSVIVIDIEVGEVNGLDLVRELRATAATARTPVLVLSGRADDATRTAALAAGATDYLMKPVSLPVLSAKLAAWGTR